MAADRGAFIDQSQSLNIHIAEPTFGKMSSMHFYAWKKGLKTGLYYLRTKPAADPIKFTVDKTRLKNTAANKTPTEKPATTATPALTTGRASRPPLPATTITSTTSPATTANTHKQAKRK